MKKKVVVINDTSNWATITDQQSGMPVKGDNYSEYLLDACRKRGMEVIPIDIPLRPNLFFITSLEKIKRGHIPFEYYLTPSILNKVKEEAGELIEKWNNLKENEIFKDSIVYQGVSLWELVKERLDHFFKLYVYIVLGYIEATKHLIDEIKPDIIAITATEGLVSGKAIIATTKNKGVPTMAIQHGVIHPYHHDYVHPKLSKDEDSRSIPDMTAVYGDYVKDILVKNSVYPSEKVIVTGQPRYDILARADEIFKKERIFEELNLDPDKHVIVYTTGATPDEREANIPIIREVFRAVKKLSGVQLVVKLHPREYDTSLYRKIAKEVDIDNIIITRDVSIYELLYACDVMITAFSTTVYEAMLLGKPVININLTNWPDLLPFAESGASIGVYKAKDIAPAIKEALENPDLRKRLGEKRAKFVYEHLYKSDGQASKRVVDLIEKMIEESKKERNEK